MSSINNSRFLFFISIFFFTHLLIANNPNTPNIPLTHCYHWIKEKPATQFLTAKYMHALENNGELSFYSTGRVKMQGDGLYCAKTPDGSYTFGNRLIRIEFVKNTVFADKDGNKVCGPEVRPDDCQRRLPDVVNYLGDWYLIQNPEVVAAWSADSQQIIYDIVEAKSYYNAAKDPLGGRYLSAANQVILEMQQSKSLLKNKLFINGNSREGGRFQSTPLEDLGTPINFDSVIDLKAYKASLEQSGNSSNDSSNDNNDNNDNSNESVGSSSINSVIKIKSATYAVDNKSFRSQRGNVTAAAASYANGNTRIVYKVNSRYLGLNEVENVSKKFAIEWTCSTEPKKIKRKELKAPAENKTFEINCD